MKKIMNKKSNKKSGEMTQIRISTSIRDSLRELGKKGDTYDDILSMLLQNHNKQ